MVSLFSNHWNPGRFWPIAFLGITYPILVIINVIFCVLWIYRLKWYFLLSLAVLIITWNNTARIIQFSNHKKDVDDGIRIVSYNVHVFNKIKDNTYLFTYDTICNKIAELHPEIACFQEFRAFTTQKRGWSKSKIDSHLSFMPYNHYIVTSKERSSIEFGLAIYSKYPIINKGSVDFPESVNGCGFADILYSEDTIRVYNIHFESASLKKKNYEFLDSVLYINHQRIDEFKDISNRLRKAYSRRSKQVEIVTQHIQQSPYPVVICGDFNDTPISYTYNQVRGELNDAFVESGKGTSRTYLGEFPSLRIDYIFYTPKFTSYNYKTVNFKVSDHLPIVCTLEKSKI